MTRFRRIWLLGASIAVLVGSGLALLLLVRPGAVPTSGRWTSPSYRFDTFPLPSKAWSVFGTIVGPDGNLWVIENDRQSDTYRGAAIARVTTAGQATEFGLPGLTRLAALVAGPDGNAWFSESDNGVGIGRITMRGVITEFAVPGDESYGAGLAFDRTGTLWVARDQFTVRDPAHLDRITSAATLANNTREVSATKLVLPSIAGRTSAPTQIVLASDGTLWVTDYRLGITRVTPDGAMTVFLPNQPIAGVATGPDGNLWAINPYGSINRITLDGAMSQLWIRPEGTPSLNLEGITPGPGSTMWFIEKAVNKIAYITKSGKVSEISLPKSLSRPAGIVEGPDGMMWFAAVPNDTAPKQGGAKDWVMVRLRIVNVGL